METTNTLVELAQNTDAQMKEYSPERKELGRHLANLCIEEGYPTNAVRIARSGGTAALDRYLVEDD